MKKEVVKLRMLDLTGMKIRGLDYLNGKSTDLECFGGRGQKIILQKICIKNGQESKVKSGKIKEITLACSIGRGIPIKALREVSIPREGLRKKSTPKTNPVVNIKKTGDRIFVETTTSVYEVK